MTWREAHKKVRELDRRVLILGGLTVVSIIVTCAVYCFGWFLDATTHSGAVFAAWVGGLILFVVIGSGVAYISLVRPEHESFDARARILFRRQTGGHIDYIVLRIKEVFEHYAEETTIDLELRSYHAGEKKYRARRKNNTVVRSYLDDIPSTYASDINFADATPAPLDGSPNVVTYVKVGDAVVCSDKTYDTDFFQEVSCELGINGKCDVSTLTEFWIKADTEANNHSPKRFTQKMSLIVENQLGVPVEIAYYTSDPAKEIRQYLQPAKRTEICEIRDALPGTIAFSYRFLAPAGTGNVAPKAA